MHNIFTITQITHKQIRYFKAVNDGAESYHTAVAIKLAIKYVKFKHNTVIKVVNYCTNILTDERYAVSYCEALKYLVYKSILYDNFNECILKSGKQTATIIKHKCEGWFNFILETISPLLKQKNKLLYLRNGRSEYMSQRIADHTKSELKQLQHHINYITALAKSRWYYELSCMIHDMNVIS